MLRILRRNGDIENKTGNNEEDGKEVTTAASGVRERKRFFMGEQEAKIIYLKAKNEMGERKS